MGVNVCKTALEQCSTFIPGGNTSHVPDALEIAYAKQHVDFAAMFFLIRFDSFPFTKLCFAQGEGLERCYFR